MYKVLMFVLKLVVFTAVNFMFLYLSMVVFGHDFGVMFKTYGNALGPFTFVLALMTTMLLPNEGTIFAAYPRSSMPSAPCINKTVF